ncbi:MAG: hypothetical protein ACRDKW_12575 [Actinomycetota bacterium]
MDTDQRSDGEGRALPCRIPRLEATRAMHGYAKGLFGLASEQVRWTRRLWVPFLLVELSYGGPGPASPDRTTRAWNLYEGLSGAYLTTLPHEPELEHIRFGARLAPFVDAGEVEADIRAGIQRLERVATASARQRYRTHLWHLGLPADAATVTIEGTRTVHVPFHVSLLERSGSPRLTAVDGVWGRAWPTLDPVLTRLLPDVLEALDQPPAPAPTPV